MRRVFQMVSATLVLGVTTSALAATGHAWLYWAWVVAYINVLPLFVRIRSIAEHGCLPRTPDMFLNTRTTKAGWLARMTVASLQVAGSVVAQQMGLGFVTAVDPTQGQQGVIVGNFLSVLGVTLIFATDLHQKARIIIGPSEQRKGGNGGSVR